MDTRRSYHYEINIIGAEQVGKTSLFKKLSEGSHKEYKSHNCIVSAFKTVQIGYRTINVRINDNPIYYKMSREVGCLYPEVSILIVAFDCTSYVDSFGVLDKTIDNYLNANKTSEITVSPYPEHIILVATKCDEIEYTQVSDENVLQYMKSSKHHFADFIKTSAKSGLGINELFEKAIQLKLKHDVSNGLPIDEKKREGLIKKLQNYIQTIESHPNPYAKNKPDFTYGFWFDKYSRAVNREANYYLAKDFLEKLEKTPENIENIFDDVNGQRDVIINYKSLFVRVGFKNRGINDMTLNSIINTARMK